MRLRDSIPYTDQIKNKISKWGANLVGVADVAELNSLEVEPVELLKGYTRAVSIAVELPAFLFEDISDRPTVEYGAAYRNANRHLDLIASRIVQTFEDDEFLGLAIPASQVLDRKLWNAAISHKAVARMAGLGWLGKSLLLITPQYGPRVRLATILTNAPLVAGSPITNHCGKCMMCRDACPANAIKGIHTKDHYHDRNEALDFSRCVEKLTTEFEKLAGVGSPICGICIKACPFGKKGRINAKVVSRD